MPTETKPTNIEVRILDPESVEMRIEGTENPKLVGYAAKFNRDSVDLGGFIERIAPGAFKNAIATSDVRCLANHDPNLVLGRNTNGTLRLAENKTGLKFDVDLPNTTTGRDWAESVKRGDVSGCSFAFTTKTDRWTYPDDGPALREILEIEELFDVGPVTYPAYPDTAVAMRSLDKAKAAVKTEPPAEKVDEKAEPVKQLTADEEFEIKQQRKRNYLRAGRIIARCRKQA
jgi:hypothetical protein